MNRAMLAVGAFLALSIPEAFSVESRIDGTVQRILVHDTEFGGCMALMSVDPQTKIAACDANWLTFDCLAAFPGSTKAGGAAKLSQAQLALVSGNTVQVRFTDSYRANGYCFANRIDVLQ